MKSTYLFTVLSMIVMVPQVYAINNGNFETVGTPNPDFPSWLELNTPESDALDLKNSAVIPNTLSIISGTRSAEMVAGATSGGGFRQAQTGQPLVFTADVKFASLQPDVAAAATSRYFGMQLKHGGATSTAQINVRVSKSGALEAYNGSAFVPVGTLVANFTTDAGTVGIWDGETPVVNTLQISANYSGTPSYSITLNGTTVSGLALFQGAVPTNGLDAVSFVGSSAAKNYLIDDVVITPVVVGYANWATTNAGSQDPSEDFDNDGVDNGCEYFMNSAPGFTANPALVGGNTVTFPNGGNIPSSSYGTQYVLQTSSDLGVWTDVLVGSLTTNTSGPGGSLTYTLTGSSPRFVRLKVTPN